MIILDDVKNLAKFNRSKVADSISKMPAQIEAAWSSALTVKLPQGDFKNLVFCGMGGSNLSSEFIRSVFGERINLPFTLTRDYHLPKFVGPSTLVFIASYSGNTEETVSCLKEARAKKAKIFCLASGGPVLALAKKNRLPYFQLDKKNNPSNQPRYDVGSQLGATLAILSRLKIIKVSEKEIIEGVEYLSILDQLFSLESPTSKNLAKSLATKFFGLMPVVVSAEFLSANAHILNNQISESAKNLSAFYLIPELNHFLLEGLNLPSEQIKKLKFLFFDSNLYSPEIRKRFLATQKVLQKKRINFVDYQVAGDSRFLAGLEILLFGSWFSFYLAVLNNQNPAVVPWVDLFKKLMKK